MIPIQPNLEQWEQRIAHAARVDETSNRRQAELRVNRYIVWLFRLPYFGRWLQNHLQPRFSPSQYKEEALSAWQTSLEGRARQLLDSSSKSSDPLQALASEIDHLQQHRLHALQDLRQQLKQEMLSQLNARFEEGLALLKTLPNAAFEAKYQELLVTLDDPLFSLTKSPFLIRLNSAYEASLQIRFPAYAAALLYRNAQAGDVEALKSTLQKLESFKEGPAHVQAACAATLSHCLNILVQAEKALLAPPLVNLTWIQSLTSLPHKLWHSQSFVEFTSPELLRIFNLQDPKDIEEEYQWRKARLFPLPSYAPVKQKLEELYLPFKAAQRLDKLARLHAKNLSPFTSGQDKQKTFVSITDDLDTFKLLSLPPELTRKLEHLSSWVAETCRFSV